MKKIINGKKYDTDTAEYLLNYDNCLGSGDFNRLREELYRKRTGEFFIYGSGGAMTQYAIAEGNGWCGGRAIRPITENEAREFVEKNGTADEYITIFGDVEE